MAWERRGTRMYYYRSVRRDGRVTKIYYGTGVIGQLAAAAEARRRGAAKGAQACDDEVVAAVALTHDLCRAVSLMVDASLLAAGYHRPGRHEWRAYRHGQRILRQAH